MYTFSGMVRYSECDASWRLTLPSLVNYLQDCSTFHCEHINRGSTYLTEHHYAWFITNWQIRIFERPRFMESVTTGTWCHAMGATNARRNFCMLRPDGSPLVHADSLWVAIDTIRNRPMRIPEGNEAFLTGDPALDLPPFRRKLRIVGEGQEMRPILVTEQHIDTNHHVNNAQYIYMADCIVREFDETFEPQWLLVQYKMPAKLGDTIVPHFHTEDNGYSVDLVNEDGKSFAIVRMTA